MPRSHSVKENHPWKFKPPINNLFCQYVTSILGAKCLMYLKDGGKFCKRHQGKSEKKFVVKGKRFRGKSVWQQEQGMFNNKSE